MTTIHEPPFAIENEYDAASRTIRQVVRNERSNEQDVFTVAYTLDGGQITGTDVGEPDGTTTRLTFAPSGYATREVRRLNRPDEVVVDFQRVASSNRALTLTVTCKRPGGPPDVLSAPVENATDADGVRERLVAACRTPKRAAP
jgi:hypothetical protein